MSPEVPALDKYAAVKRAGWPLPLGYGPRTMSLTECDQYTEREGASGRGGGINLTEGEVLVKRLHAQPEVFHDDLLLRRR